ncbi:MAG: hypothetical protein NTV64_00050, partial [Polaromonas sp.]|nr:hypothetical protein [Polaromonas sp.]
LVQAALEGPTRVDSVAWIDGQGVLREGSSFRSGMQVRGVQVLSYLRDSSGRPQAQLKLQEGKASPDGITADLAAAAKPRDCEKQVSLKHLIGLQIALDGQWSHQDAALAYTLSQFGRDQVLQAGASASAWRMIQQSSDKLSAYEQILTSSGEQNLPWRAVVSVSPVPAQVRSAAPQQDLKTWWRENPLWGDTPTFMRIHFAVTAQGSSKPFFAASADIPIPADSGAYRANLLPPQAREQVARHVRQWTQALDSRLACESVKPEVTQARGADLRINAGTLAGVRAGDEWVLADQRRFPHQILEAGVGAQVVLARVQRVYAHHAQLQVLAGPADQVRTQWRAWQPQTMSGLDVLR